MATQLIHQEIQTSLAAYLSKDLIYFVVLPYVRRFTDYVSIEVTRASVFQIDNYMDYVDRCPEKADYHYYASVQQQYKTKPLYISPLGLARRYVVGKIIHIKLLKGVTVYQILKECYFPEKSAIKFTIGYKIKYQDSWNNLYYDHEKDEWFFCFECHSESEFKHLQTAPIEIRLISPREGSLYAVDSFEI